MSYQRNFQTICKLTQQKRFRRKKPIHLNKWRRSFQRCFRRTFLSNCSWSQRNIQSSSQKKKKNCWRNLQNNHLCDFQRNCWENFSKKFLKKSSTKLNKIIVNGIASNSADGISKNIAHEILKEISFQIKFPRNVQRNSIE